MSTDDCLCTALRRAALASTALYDEALAPSGLKVTMYRLMKKAAGGEPPSISELARRLGLDRSTLGRNVRVLERERLVALRSVADGRERAVTLTAKGRAALEATAPLWRAAQRDLRRRLDGRDAELLDIVRVIDPEPRTA